MSKGNKDSKNTPFKKLGDSLRQLREVRSESLAEVSGAVEIEIDTLNSYELGKDRPSEDILLLLISHFGTKEDEATKLWELAGFNDFDTPAGPASADQNTPDNSIAVMPPDVRIAYTDMVHVMANNYGVVMNFMQGAGPNNQPLAIARIGMSKEHARSVLEVLQKTLAQSEPKSLPQPKNTTTNRKPNKKKSSK